MKKVRSVRFKDNGKTYYFDPADTPIKTGDYVIVETARGVECGEVVQGVKEIADSAVPKALKPITRMADSVDVRRMRQNREDEKRAYHTCQECIARHGLEMKLVEAEYTLDRSKIMFYFTADGELAADNLDDLGMAAIGKLFGGLAGGKVGTIEYGALNELVLLQVGDRLLDGALVDIGLTDDDGGVEVMGHAAKLLDLGSCQCHGFSLSMYGAPRDGALIYVSCPTIAQERRGVGRVCPVQKECGCRVGEQCGL